MASLSRFVLSLCALGSTFAGLASAASLSPSVVYHHNLFYQGMVEGVAGYRIPALLCAQNGDVLAALDERVPHLGDLKFSPNINIALRRSHDGGKTWGDVKIVVDFPQGQSASDPSFILDEKTGHIFLFYNYMDLEKEKDVYYLHYIKSEDHGRTWSQPVDITQNISKPEWARDFKFITSGRGICTRDGKLLHTMVNLHHGLHVFGSDDHGETWYFIDTPLQPANESKIVELSDGRWMVNSRVNNAEKRRYVHISADEGQSWQTAKEDQLPDPACNASIIRYEHKGEKSCLLFCNANSDKGRENLCLRLSDNDGQTWSKGLAIYEGGSAYSSMCVLKDGNIAIFFEKDGYKNNEFLVIPRSWLEEERASNSTD